MSRIVEIVAYDPEWAQNFADESAKIKSVLGANCIEVHHIVSTSIPGLSAKPVYVKI